MSSKIFDTGMEAIAQGEAIVRQTQQRFGLGDDAEDDGPLMKKWKRGDFPVKSMATSAIDSSMEEKVATIIASERAGRLIVAALGLARLREQFEALNPEEVPADERTWPAFAGKRFPFSIDRMHELIGRMVHRGGLLRCTKCGAGAKCSCSCGAPYIGEYPSVSSMPVEPAKAPTALDRAAAAVAAHPEKSDRALAAEIGINHKTIAKARRSLPDSPVDSPVEGRVGRDGRRRRAPAKQALPPLNPDHDLIQEMHPDADTPEQRWQWSMSSAAGDAIAMRAFWNREFGDWQQFESMPELLTLADQAVAAWQTVQRDLRKRRKYHGESKA